MTDDADVEQADPIAKLAAVLAEREQAVKARLAERYADLPDIESPEEREDRIMDDPTAWVTAGGRT